MTTRDQLTHERLEALIELLVAEGVISRDWADSLESTRDLGDGLAVAEAARAGNGPPDFANGGDQGDRSDG